MLYSGPLGAARAGRWRRPDRVGIALQAARYQRVAHGDTLPLLAHMGTQRQADNEGGAEEINPDRHGAFL